MPAGSYTIDGIFKINEGLGHALRIYNVTDSITIDTFSLGYIPAGQYSIS